MIQKSNSLPKEPPPDGLPGCFHSPIFILDLTLKHHFHFPPPHFLFFNQNVEIISTITSCAVSVFLFDLLRLPKTVEKVSTLIEILNQSGKTLSTLSFISIFGAATHAFRLLQSALPKCCSPRF